VHKFGAVKKAWPDLREPQPSVAAGLFLLVAVLQRLGLESTLDQESDLIASAFGWRVLEEAAFRLAIPKHDPVLFAARPRSPPEPLPQADFEAPQSWWRELVDLAGGLTAHECGPDRYLIHGAWPGLSLALRAGQPPADLTSGDPLPEEGVRSMRRNGWVAAMDLWCQRVLDMGLAALVKRPGWVSATATHVDVVFPLNAVDLTIRRETLDASPGWVPWLGRILTFHYVPAGAKSS
jgi:hypothetical protein